MKLNLKLTKQIEKITNYEVQQNLLDEIARLKNQKIRIKKKDKECEKKYTIGNVNFDSVVIAILMKA